MISGLTIPVYNPEDPPTSQFSPVLYLGDTVLVTLEGVTLSCENLPGVLVGAQHASPTPVLL